MLIKDTIPFVDKTTTLPQPVDLHLEQQDISITMPNRQQLHIHNICIPPRSRCSADHNASIAHLLCNSKISLIVGDINVRHSTWDTSTNKDKRGEQLADRIDTVDYTILRVNEATRLLSNGWSTSLDTSLASCDIALLSGQSPPHWPAIIYPFSSPSTLNCP